MKFLLFIVAVLVSLNIIVWPLFAWFATKSEIVIYIGFAWFLIIGVTNQWIQHKLESILE